MSQHPRQKAKRVPLREAMPRLWRPPFLAENGMALALYRAWLVSIPVMIVSMLIVTLEVALWLLLRRLLIPVTTFFDVVALAMLPTIFRASSSLLLVIPRGYWTRKGVPVRRDEQPFRFWFWTAVQLLGLVISTAGAVFLISVGGGSR